ncbi:MAG: hypothetical protein WC792_03215 [Candidatus Micrarchaeia archaeon]|jgi:hypothetical protein
MALKEEEGKKFRHEPEACDKLAEQTQAVFAKEYDYSLFEIRDLLEHGHELHEMSVYLSGNQYYSDTLAKAVFELKIDSDLVVLKLERAALKDLIVVNSVEKSILRGEKPKVSKAEVAALAANLEALSGEVDRLYERACDLVSKIKVEFKEHGR